MLERRIWSQAEKMNNHEIIDKLPELKTALSDLIKSAQAVAALINKMTPTDAPTLHYCFARNRCDSATPHAVGRYVERTGSNRGIGKILSKISSRIEAAEEWEIKPEFAVNAMLAHGFGETTYWHHGGLLFIVENKIVVTVHSMEANRWRKKM